MKTLMTFECAAIFLAAFYLMPTALAAQGPATLVPPPPAAPIIAPFSKPLYAAIGDKPAILYDGLSAKSNKVFILSRFHPIEVLVKLDKWTKVRDMDGSVGWVENSAVSDRRFVQVAANVAEIRMTPMPASPLVFEAQRGVLLEIAGVTVDGWVPVRHRDGQGGFVRSLQVWGG